MYNDNLTQPQFKQWIDRTVGKEGEDACRHDKWCCMMFPRLMLLKELLREDGSIWISIDDNEVHHLRVILDEVFGAENFVATVIWQKMDSPKNTALHLSEDHDFIIIYAKDAETWRPNPVTRSEAMLARYKNPDNDPRGPWLLSDLAARNPYSSGRYAIKTPSGKVISGPPAGSYWRVSKEKFDELAKENRIWWGKTGSNRPGIKRFLSDVREGVVPQTLWLWKEVGSTRHAKQELNQLMEAGPAEDVFVSPKPVALLRRIIEISTKPGEIVLDSFAGSGTTGHAALVGNGDAGSGRRFVLVQLPHDNKDHEKKRVNLCRELTAERIRRVSKKNGSFTYARVGEPLFGEYRNFGKRLPEWETLARYIFYTETSRDSDSKKFNEKTGFIGETQAAGGTSYYLLYTPNEREDREVSLDWLGENLKRDKNRTWVIYTERIWLHQDELRQFEREHGRRVRTMIVPFNLR